MLSRKVAPLVLFASLILGMGGVSKVVYAQQPSSASCQGVSLQVLGSGGPELDDGRTSSAYLLWVDEKAKVLVDVGSASSARFGDAGAGFADIDTILLSHLHTDHAADLPSFIKGSYFTHRTRDLPIYGPDGNDTMPSTEEYVAALLGKGGAFKYLSSYLQPAQDDYLIRAYSVIEPEFKTQLNEVVSIEAMAVPHGPIPALAWKVRLNNCVAVFSGDTNDANSTLAAFAKGADVVVLHNAIDDTAGRVAKSLHMTPEQIIAIAKQSGAKRIVLSHFMKRSEKGIATLVEAISVVAPGRVYAAQDLMTITL